MELRDLLVAPVVLLLICAAAYLVRPYFTDSQTSKYFIPALILKLFCAIMLGVVYQFYYGGGDTYNYHTYGSRIVWEAFMQSPTDGFKLIWNNGSDFEGIYRYTSRITFFNDHASYTVVRLASIFDLLTLSSYAGTALLFACLSFVGNWLLFQTFYSMYPLLVRWLAWATLFIPSVVFWGSGILKDTITMSFVGIATYTIHQLLIRRNRNPVFWMILLFVMYGLYSIKIYILMAFIPATILWVSLHYLKRIRAVFARILLFPFVISLTMVLGFFAVQRAGEGNSKYALSKIAETSRITAYDIGFFTGRNAGSGYSLGELDGTWQSMARLTPGAINVSLFRPYLWEVSNPLMLLSGLESLGLALLTLYVIFRCRWQLVTAMTDPDILFCFVFSVTFAFAVGVSTFNFGSLVRYKIPLMPFYLTFLILVLHRTLNVNKGEPDSDPSAEDTAQLLS